MFSVRFASGSRWRRGGQHRGHKDRGSRDGSDFVEQTRRSGVVPWATSALIFFLIQPSGLFIASADPTDAAATIDALASNAALAKLTVLVIAVGLIWTTFGIYVLQSNLRGGDGDALTRIGLAGIGIGTIGWITAQGLNLVMADAATPDAVAESVFAVRLGITLLSGVGIALGFLVFSLGIASRGRFQQDRRADSGRGLGRRSDRLSHRDRRFRRGCDGLLDRQSVLPRLDSLGRTSRVGPVQAPHVGVGPALTDISRSRQCVAYRSTSGFGRSYPSRRLAA